MRKNSYSIKDLKNLVKSLSTAEKRHFSLLSSAFAASSKEPLYIRLFQQLSQAQSEHSDPSGMEDLPEITTVKNRLFQNILRSLRMFHQQKSVEIDIQNKLSDIEILYSLGLPEQSYYLFRKAYKEAVEYEKFALLLQLLEWEKKLNIVLDHPLRSIDEIDEEERLVLQKLQQLMELESFFGRMKGLKRQYGQISDKLDKAFQEEIPSITRKITYEECMSQKAKFYYNYTYAIYNWIIYNHKDAYLYSKRLLNPEIGRILPNDYIDGILEHATACIHIAAFTEALEVLELAQQIAGRPALEPVLSTKLFFYTVGYHLVIYNYMGDKERLEQAISRAEYEIKDHEAYMPREAKHVLSANLMNAYVGIHATQKADELWESLFQKTSKTIRRSIYDDLRLFRLFSLLHDKVYAVIPSFALSAYRYYSLPEHNPDYFELELGITALLQKENDLEDPLVRYEVLSAIKRIVAAYISCFENANNFQEHYSLYAIWIDSIIREQPFYKVAGAWYKSLGTI